MDFDRATCQVEASRECLEIAIPRDERDIGVDARLGDQGVSKPGFSFSGKDLCAKPSGPIPESVSQRDQWEFEESLSHRSREFRVAQQFCQYRRRHYHLAGLKRLGQGVNIVSLLSLKERNPGTGVSRDHRSAFNSSSVLENRTFP